MSSVPKATPIILTGREPAELEGLARSAKSEHRMRQRARIVLLAADGMATRVIARDPMCGDKNAMEWAHAWMAKEQPPSNKVGFMYIASWGWRCQQHRPLRDERGAGQYWVKTGSHVMIVGPGAKMLEGYPRVATADPTKPYVMWPGTPYEHLMPPVQ